MKDAPGNTSAEDFREVIHGMEHLDTVDGFMVFTLAKIWLVGTQNGQRVLAQLSSEALGHPDQRPCAHCGKTHAGVGLFDNVPAGRDPIDWLLERFRRVPKPVDGGATDA